MGARKEGFKKRTVAGKDRGYRIVGAFVKSLSRINELIFYFGGNFEFRKHNVFCCSVNLQPNVLARLGEATIGGIRVPLFKPLSLIRVLLKASLSSHINSAMYSQKSCGG